jgi:hypothetical protein
MDCSFFSVAEEEKVKKLPTPALQITVVYSGDAAPKEVGESSTKPAQKGVVKRFNEQSSFPFVL